MKQVGRDATRNVLVLKSGSTAAPVRVALGDYDRWFAAALAPCGCAVRVVDAHRGEQLPREVRAFDRVVITGSPHSVLEDAPWMKRVAEYARESAARGIPVLGVCFGHQLLARAFGGEVRRNPAGREIGTVTCTLTAAGERDPLFAGVPRTFAVQTTHEDVVVEAPPGAELLATNSFATNQGFRLGPDVWAVQFHPEVTTETMAAMVAARAQGLAAEAAARGEDPRERVRSILAAIRPAPFGAAVLRNFVMGATSARNR
ncbi:MAG TPA: glutamine amidotransferase [Anaeromyxobacteraceae bacterium]|nr:glutamine amidotransferase [Anaeromyxobacteraceae bacterium]